MLSVVVPAYNEEEFIEKCLDSLKRQTKEFELVIVDNNSTDRTKEIAKRYGRVLTEKKKGYHNAVKKGIDSTKGDIIAVCDADSYYPEDWAEQIISKMGDNIGIYGRVFFYDGNRLLNSVYEAAFFCFMLVMPVFGIHVCNGLNFAFRKSAYTKVGGYDPRIWDKAGIDIHLGMRLSRIGKMKFVKSMKAYTSLRRIKSKGMLNMIKINYDIYSAFIFKKDVKASYSEYNLK